MVQCLLSLFSPFLNSFMQSFQFLSSHNDIDPNKRKYQRQQIDKSVQAGLSSSRFDFSILSVGCCFDFFLIFIPQFYFPSLLVFAVKSNRNEYASTCAHVSSLLCLSPTDKERENYQSSCSVFGQHIVGEILKWIQVHNIRRERSVNHIIQIIIV